ncbi:V-type ATPase subunit [Aerococcaceae bacterium WGS1372]
MQNSLYGPLNMTVRVQENHLLDQSQYDRMLRAQSYEEAVRVLLDTNYRDGVQEAIETKDYEPMLRKELIDTYQWILDQSPSDLINELMTLRYAYHNIKVLYKEKLTGKDFDSTLIDIGVFPIYEFRKEVSQDEESVNLPKYYKQNIRNLNIEFAEAPRLSDIDIFVDRAYIHHLKRLSEEIDDEAVTQYINRIIDNTNVSIFFRAISSNLGKNHIQATITDEGSISQEFFVQLVDQGLEAAIEAFKDMADYGAIMDDAIGQDNQLSLRRLEKALDNATETYLEQAHFSVFGPIPVLAFISAKEIEIKNIRLALTGQLNRIDPEIVRDRMRLDYAV